MISEAESQYYPDQVSYSIGKHLLVGIYPQSLPHQLSSGEWTPPGSPFGTLDLTRNLNLNDAPRTRIGRVQLLLRYTLDFLKLIHACQSNEIPASVRRFEGITHLGNMAFLEELHFTVSNPNLFTKLDMALLGCRYSNDFSWKSIKREWKQTKKISFSRDELLAMEDKLVHHALRLKRLIKTLKKVQVPVTPE